MARSLAMGPAMSEARAKTSLDDIVPVSHLEAAASAAPLVVGQVIEGGPLDDSLMGTAGDDTIRGVGGDDTLNGVAGNDALFGGNGTDLLSGDNGNDTLFGG